MYAEGGGGGWRKYVYLAKPPGEQGAPASGAGFLGQGEEMSARMTVALEASRPRESSSSDRDTACPGAPRAGP